MEPTEPTTLSQQSMEPTTLSHMSITERLSAMLPCEDETCSCISKKSTVVIISIINFIGCVMDLMTSDTCISTYCPNREYVESVRKVLGSLFQVANLLLLLASVFEKAFLVDIYVWVTLGYIVMGFVLSICEFVTKYKREGARRSLTTFVPEVIFYFVVFRCLPLVDLYRRHLHSMSAIGPGSNETSQEISQETSH